MGVVSHQEPAKALTFLSATRCGAKLTFLVWSHVVTGITSQVSTHPANSSSVLLVLPLPETMSQWRRVTTSLLQHRSSFCDMLQLWQKQELWVHLESPRMLGWPWFFLLLGVLVSILIFSQQLVSDLQLPSCSTCSLLMTHQSVLF